MVTSQGYFPKWQLAKCVISQAVTSQAFLGAARGPLDHPSHKARPHCSLRRFRGPNLTFGKLPLGNYTLGKLAIGILSLGKLSLGKRRPWENAFGKVSDTLLEHLVLRCFALGSIIKNGYS